MIRFLSTCSDRELAFFIRYRLPVLSPELRNEVLSFAYNQRRWKQADISQLLLPTSGQSFPVTGHCRRCDSTKIETDSDKHVCIVCGYLRKRSLSRLLRRLGNLLSDVLQAAT